MRGPFSTPITPLPGSFFHADPQIEILVSAFHVTRPSSDGRFPVADFETLHRNLSAAFPDEAAIASARLTEAATA